MQSFRFLLFWLNRQPDSDANRMTHVAWTAFVESMAGLLAIVVAIAIVAVVVGYVLHARKLRIIYPDHYFHAFTPLRWPWAISLIPAALMLWRYVVEYKRRFPATEFSPIGPAIIVAVWAFLLTYLISRVLVMLPGVTPRKFRYRPIELFISKARLTSTAGKEAQ